MGQYPDGVVTAENIPCKYILLFYYITIISIITFKGEKNYV